MLISTAKGGFVRVPKSALQQRIDGALRTGGRFGICLEKVGFLPSDPLYVRVRLAYDAMHSLCMDLHYRSCKSGVGKPTDE